MARTPSTMSMELGATAPDFNLPNTNRSGGLGERVSLGEAMGEHGVLVMFLCNHCPFVKHIREELARLGVDAAAAGVGVVAISSNDVANYPDDSPEKMTEEANEAGYTFAYLYDESQEVAKAYSAACTPDFFLFDADRKLVYRGQVDGARPGNDEPSDGADMRAAIEALVGGGGVIAEQKPSIGCNIKWIEGNAPSYA